MPLWDLLKSALEKHSVHTISEKNASMSFYEMSLFAETFAETLTESCYGILCQSELATSMAILSCLAARVTAVPLSMRYGERHYRKIVDHIKMPAIITDIGGEIHCVNINTGEYQSPQDPISLIMCTSGSTGHPKGVMLTEKNISTNLEDICHYFHITESDTILIERPLYHCAVLNGEFFAAIIQGANIRFCSDAFNPKNIIHEIESFHITTMCGTPTIFSLLNHMESFPCNLPLRKIVLSGEPLPENTARRIRKMLPDTEIYHVYGLTEASPRVSYLPPQLFDLYPTSIGFPLRSEKVAIVDQEDHLLLPGQVGELVVRGENVMLGYYGDNEYTNTTLKGGWLHTGDMGYKAPNGLYYIKGRKDNMVIRAGMNIYPQEIENALLSDSRVEDVIVYTEKHDQSQKIKMLIKGNFAQAQEVRHLCIDLLPSYAIPNEIEITSCIPHNASGKKFLS